MSQIAINVEKLCKTIDKKPILKDVGFSIETGSTFGFLGPNGAWKTTTMKCILSLIKATSGSVSILGNGELDASTRSRIGFMPENTYLYKYLTGREFLRFNGKFFDIAPDTLEKRISELLEKVGLSHAGDTRLSKYSKGMLQRIGLAQSIVNDPEVVFLDEPMSWLDPLGRKMVKDLIVELKEQGKTVFFNTHILSDVESICDRFAIIAKGSIVADGKIADLKEPLEDFFLRVITESSEGPITIH